MIDTAASRRLAACRAKAADWKLKQPTLTHYHDWRAHRRPVTPNNGGTWQPLDTLPRFTSPRAYYCDNFPAGVRDLGDAHKLAELRHTGWYADSFQSELVCGRVLQLPARNGTPCYIPAIYLTECDGVTLYPLDRYEEARDAARAADHYAEREAEACCEHDAEFQAEQQTEELQARIVENRAELRSLVREMKALRPVAPAASYRTICATLRASIAALRKESHKAHKRIAALRDNPWLAVEG